MSWARHGAFWPNAEYSRFVDCRPVRWHVQVAGEGPTVLLLHGAGGATQSWRDVLPGVARFARVVAPDFPGQGFSTSRNRMRMGMESSAADLAQLLAQEDWRPDLIVGHSAGAALALELAGNVAPHAVLSLNGALGAFQGVAGWLFPMMAGMLSLNPLLPPLIARMAGQERRVRDLLAGTGSRIDDGMLRYYRLLAGDAGHIDGTVTMMSQWRLDRLLARLPEITVPTRLIAGAMDRTVPPTVSRRAAEVMPNATFRQVEDAGHLLHEELPEVVVEEIRTLLSA